jgi:hypothetical protein
MNCENLDVISDVSHSAIVETTNFHSAYMTASFVHVCFDASYRNRGNYHFRRNATYYNLWSTVGKEIKWNATREGGVEDKDTK